MILKMIFFKGTPLEKRDHHQVADVRSSNTPIDRLKWHEKEEQRAERRALFIGDALLVAYALAYVSGVLAESSSSLGYHSVLDGYSHLREVNSKVKVIVFVLQKHLICFPRILLF